jgi:acetylglutamate kinase
MEGLMDEGLLAAGATPAEFAELLAAALPYIQRFHGQTFVIKYGGAAMAHSDNMAQVVRNVLLLQSVGIRPILVHGGGPEIDRWLERLGMEKKTLNGLRVTDEGTLEVVEMVLSGRSNKALVAEISRNGGQAVGLSGRDGNLLIAEPISPELGRVGEVVEVNPAVLAAVAEAGFVPVVATVADDREGQALNVNADSAAAAIAASLGATKLILLTDTNGVLADKHDPRSTISTLSAGQAREMIESGAADRGMIPKLNAALRALEAGVAGVHLLDGGMPNALLIEVFTDAGVGTMVCS